MAKKQTVIEIAVPPECLKDWLKKLAKVESKLRKATSS